MASEQVRFDILIEAKIAMATMKELLKGRNFIKEIRAEQDAERKAKSVTLPVKHYPRSTKIKINHA